MRDFGLLLMRLTVGGLVAGHGAQKLFGWFGGHGPEGTRNWLASMGLRPAGIWALLAGIGEVGSGLFTALGLFNPLGTLMMFGPMGVAITRVHWNKPIWVASGGAELPVTNLAVATGLLMTGPGRFALDKLLNIKVPFWLSSLTFLSTMGALYVATIQTPTATTAESTGTASKAEPGTPGLGKAA